MIEKRLGTTDDDIAGKIYISGPITNVENWQENFIAAEKELLELKKPIAVVNPLRISERIEKDFALAGRTPSYSDYMREDIKALAECDAICLLPGWGKSKGANVEYKIALSLNLAVLEYIPD